MSFTAIHPNSAAGCRACGSVLVVAPCDRGCGRSTVLCKCHGLDDSEDDSVVTPALCVLCAMPRYAGGDRLGHLHATLALNYSCFAGAWNDATPDERADVLAGDPFKNTRGAFRRIERDGLVARMPLFGDRARSVPRVIDGGGKPRKRGRRVTSLRVVEGGKC